MVTAIMMDIPKGQEIRIIMEKQKLMMLCAMAEVTVSATTTTLTKQTTFSNNNRISAECATTAF